MLFVSADVLCKSDQKLHRLRVPENRVLKIFGPKRDEVTGDWRKLHNGEVHNLYSLPSINKCSSQEDDIGRAYSTDGVKRNAYSTLAGKPE
jgi:hypothetical protein